MAKRSMIEREKRRVASFKKHVEKRKKLKATIVDLNLSDEDRMDAVKQLQELPRDSSRCRQRNRCRLCGRSRAYNRLTGLCRIHMRGAVMSGFVPGMHKASW
jgi:small subunit ribosomal protein S14